MAMESARSASALSGDALRANLKRILEQNYKKEGGEFAKLTFDGVGGKGLEAGAAGTVVLPTGSNATVAECVRGLEPGRLGAAHFGAETDPDRACGLPGRAGPGEGGRREAEDRR